MELKKGTISHLQEYVHSKIKDRGFEDEPLNERLLMLTEELGELAKACRKINGMYVKQNNDHPHTLGGEVTDVINMIFAVGIKLGLDMEKEFVEKEAEVDTRIYQRSEKKHA